MTNHRHAHLLAMARNLSQSVEQLDNALVGGDADLLAVSPKFYHDETSKLFLEANEKANDLNLASLMAQLLACSQVIAKRIEDSAKHLSRG